MNNRTPLQRKVDHNTRRLSCERLTAGQSVLAADVWLLSNELHDWCVSLLRKPDPRFSSRSEKTFPNYPDALNVVEVFVEAYCGDYCLCFDYALDIGPSFRISKQRILEKAKIDPTFLSREGLFITDLHVSAAVFIDFESVDSAGRPDGLVGIHFYGAAATA